MPAPEGAPVRAAGSSLRRRLLQRLLVPLLALFAIGGVGAYGLARHFANGVYDDWLYDSANSLALLVRRGPTGIVLELPDAARRALEWDVKDRTYYRVIGADGRTLAGDAALPDAGDDVIQVRDARLFDALIGSNRVRIAQLGIPAARWGEAIRVEVGETGRKRLALAREILLGTLLPQAVLILTAAAIIGFGIRTALEPLLSLAARIDEQDPRHLRPIADAGVPEEITPLTGAVNALLERLEVALVAQRRFVADAAHQLRTPLTALRLNLDQARLEADSAPATPALRHCLAQLGTSIERATRLSQQLLALARAEPDAVAVAAFQAQDLRDLAFAVGMEWVPRALARGLDLSFDAPQPAEARVNEALVREALNNLLDNAVQYHPGRGRVRLSVTPGPPSITVADDGMGIPEQHRAEVFKRFHRGDRSGGEGSGLGLAIAQEIMIAHDGRAVLGPGLDGRGVSVRLEFPTPTGPAAPREDLRRVS